MPTTIIKFLIFCYFLNLGAITKASNDLNEREKNLNQTLKNYLYTPPVKLDKLSNYIDNIQDKDSIQLLFPIALDILTNQISFFNFNEDPNGAILKNSILQKLKYFYPFWNLGNPVQLDEALLSFIKSLLEARINQTIAEAEYRENMHFIIEQMKLFSSQRFKSSYADRSYLFNHFMAHLNNLNLGISMLEVSLGDTLHELQLFYPTTWPLDRSKFEQLAGFNQTSCTTMLQNFHSRSEKLN